MPTIIGLTGGIGSGKTTVSHLFQKLGVPIIDADVISHQLTEKNQLAYHKIIAHFGESILSKDNTINRTKLREIIFKNPLEKKWLEDLLHPLIRQTIRDEIKKVTTPYCICVIPLLLESKGNYAFLDRILVVDTPITLQLERVKKRDQNNQVLIEKIISSQATREARLKIADDVLTNDVDLNALEKQVRELHARFISGCNSKL